MTNDEIEECVRRYLDDGKTTSRYASFDYCFSHVQGYREDDRLEQLLEPEHLQLACLQQTLLGVFGCVPAFDRFVNKGLGCPASGGRP